MGMFHLGTLNNISLLGNQFGIIEYKQMGHSRIVGEDVLSTTFLIGKRARQSLEQN